MFFHFLFQINFEIMELTEKNVHFFEKMYDAENSYLIYNLIRKLYLSKKRKL